MIIEYLLIFILSVIFSIIWEWTRDKHKRVWYLYVGMWMTLLIAMISSIIFNPQSSDRKVLTSWEGISLIISSLIGWIVGEKIYHYDEK